MTTGASGARSVYEVRFGRAAQRALERLPLKIAAAVVEFITGPLAENPHRLSKPLRDDLAGHRSARRGAYRVLLRIDEDAHAILITDIDHRAHVYRPR